MKKAGIILLLCVSIFMYSGCAVFNPYEDTFSCPEREKGKCVSVEDAYEESLSGKDKGVGCDVTKITRRGRIAESKSTSKTQKDGNVASKPDEGSGTELTYQKQVFKKLSGLLEKPTTPLMVPPTVMRVLFLPYKDEGNRLYMTRYVYCIVDEAQWVIGNDLPEGVGINWED